MEVKVNGKSLCTGEPCGVAVIFNNLTGANFDDRAGYFKYLDWISAKMFGAQIHVGDELHLYAGSKPCVKSMVGAKNRFSLVSMDLFAGGGV